MTEVPCGPGVRDEKIQGHGTEVFSGLGSGPKVPVVFVMHCNPESKHDVT